MRLFLRNLITAGALCVLLVGCGATQQRTGTEQLLLSDAVDRSVDAVDFGWLRGRNVYLDTKAIAPVKGNMFVNADYIVAALRHKLIVSGVRLAESADKSDYIMEARMGALGADTMEVTYGIPASNGLNQAANLVSGVPALPAIPEISVGKRNNAQGVSKLMLFAYHRETGEPVWQSGRALARSDVKDTWLFGAGPLQRGSIYEKAAFAGVRFRWPWSKRRIDAETTPVTLTDTHQFVHPAALETRIAEESRAAEEAARLAAAEAEAAAAAAQQASAEQADDAAVTPADHEE